MVAGGAGGCPARLLEPRLLTRSIVPMITIAIIPPMSRSPKRPVGAVAGPVVAIYAV